ncbi:DUF418 domain-containing protein [uncultured Pseudoalteromonas sp.]|uniref:DUF418 domain-containing protein n=1 Tax=uncultured Pseudoalteromonas sp. TaxID=114053 RepID=UPI000C5B086F|nr:DUF418 domain-containing protein [uncultured Pseudoalteromonas sp.]MBD58370.1 hypothetical protein [Pseudoalteromonas sp.]|tara:strand:- start:1267 stop:2349 length:1083 start_codon:yes stop_codon:yes gene_type:complete
MRNINMDVLRGIAVLGLMFMNIYTFAMFEYDYTPSSSPPISDSIINIINVLFIDGRFRSLFCLLFGASLVIQWQLWQSIDKQHNRLKVLAYIGLAHGFLLWAGDILFIYACAGWLTLKFSQQDNEKILRMGMLFLLLGAFISFLLAFVEPELTPLTRSSDAFLMAYDAAYSSYFAGFVSNVLMFTVMLIAVPLITMWMAAGLMLVGVYLYKQGVFVDGLTKAQLNMIVPAAIGLTVVRLMIDPNSSVFMYAIVEPINWLAALAMAICYCHIIVKIVKNKSSKWLLLQQAGRMSLTLYLMQTVIFILFFKVAFSSAALNFDRIDYWLVIAGVLVFQLVFCKVYSQYFKHGPCELIWRKLSR